MRAFVLLGLLATACSDAAKSGAPTVPGVADAAIDVASADGSLAHGGELDANLSDAASKGLLLLDHKSWRRYPAELDPLAVHQPAELLCRDSATFVELGSYEVDTTRCNYLLAEHPALRDVPAGSDVQVTLLHYDLSAPEPAEGHVALLFGNVVQWEIAVPIPRPADVIEARFTTNVALAVGEPIRLHLHNHGGNAWLLVSVEQVSR